jgi:hypothetical protein
MTNEPKFGMEQWSPAGWRASRRAIRGGTLHGVSLLILTLGVVIAIADSGFLDGISCFVILLLFVCGIVMIVQSTRIDHRMRASAVVVVTLSLTMTFLFAGYLGLLVVFNGVAMFRRLNVIETVFLVLIVSIPISGSFTAWQSMMTLRHWPKKLGTGFQVELVETPADSSKKG